MTMFKSKAKHTQPCDAVALAGQAMYDAAIRAVRETDDVARFEAGLMYELIGRDPVELEVEEMFSSDEAECGAATHGGRNSRCVCERSGGQCPARGMLTTVCLERTAGVDRGSSGTCSLDRGGRALWFKRDVLS